jgi:glutamine synthetase
MRSKITLDESPNAALDKTLLNKYYALPQPENKIQAKYIWIDGTGESVRSKTRTIDFIPKQPVGNYKNLYNII